MKNYFINLLNYDKYCNLLLLKLILEAGEPEKPAQLMAHLLAAQQVWLGRLQGFDNPPAAALWPAGDAKTFEQIINSNHTDWLSFVNQLVDNDMSKIISYKNFQNVLCESTMSDIFTHVINHGTHHRAQVGQHLKLAGISALPTTDYIAFTRL
jgi:uncharacterized damage-inducible protein DinB